MRVIIQKDRKTGETVIQFTQDHTASVDDFIVTAMDSEVTVENVLLVASAPVLAMLTEAEFHSVAGSAACTEPVVLTEAQKATVYRATRPCQRGLQ